MTPAIRIGDWEVSVLGEEIFTVPQDGKLEPQAIVEYRFHHMPQDYTIDRTVHYIKPKSDERRKEYLTLLTKDFEKILLPKSPKEVKNVS